MSNSVPDVVSRYFSALNNREGEGLLELFTPDAVVVDEGETWRGTSEIRTWVEDVAFRFQYTAEVLGVEAAVTEAMLPAFSSRATFQAGQSNSTSASMSMGIGSVDWRTRRKCGQGTARRAPARWV